MQLSKQFLELVSVFIEASINFLFIFIFIKAADKKKPYAHVQTVLIYFKRLTKI
jgi:hypothetical protein